MEHVEVLVDPLADLPWPADPPQCDCMELGAQICHIYENWCDKVSEVEWWNGMTREERQGILDWNENAYHNYLCWHAPTTECAGWLDSEEGILF